MFWCPLPPLCIKMTMKNRCVKKQINAFLPLATPLAYYPNSITSQVFAVYDYGSQITCLENLQGRTLQAVHPRSQEATPDPTIHQSVLDTGSSSTQLWMQL